MSAWAKGFLAKRLRILEEVNHRFCFAVRRFAGIFQTYFGLEAQKVSSVTFSVQAIDSSCLNVDVADLILVSIQIRFD